MLALDGAGREKQAVGDIGFQRFWPVAWHDGLHAAQRRPVVKPFGRNRVRVGSEMPDREDGFIGLPVGQSDDFDFRQLVGMIQIECHNGRVCEAGSVAKPN